MKKAPEGGLGRVPQKLPLFGAEGLVDWEERELMALGEGEGSLLEGMDSRRVATNSTSEPECTSPVGGWE